VRTLLGAIGAVVWTGAFAVVMTALVSGVWTGLLVVNLKVSPAIPWATVVMAGLLWLLWSYLCGRWAPKSTQLARRRLLRGGQLPARVFAIAVVAGVVWVGFLANFWILLHRLAPTPSNPLPDFSKLPVLTVLVSLAMASISGGVSEEAGFRGYFQGELERRGLGPFAILIAALVMSPEHALSQGFVWPNLLFYLFVDAMLGALAYITKSIRPSIVVHAVGLFVFFVLVWPHDKDRHLLGPQGADAAFWVDAALAAGCAAVSLALVIYLAKLAGRRRQTAETA
jgi:membrane protease YdiL (CAAX protease family)